MRPLSRLTFVRLSVVGQFSDHAVMFSDRDLDRTARDVARARANIARWKTAFGRREFGDVSTVEIFSRLDGQLAGNRLVLMMSKAVRDEAANNDLRCDWPGCTAKPHSRCSKCQSARYCSADHVRRP